jgi:anion-transporting  ArsA/GET3 family ATPase
VNELTRFRATRTLLLSIDPTAQLGALAQEQIRQRLQAIIPI